MPKPFPLPKSLPKPSKPQPPRLLTFQFTPNPRALNPTTHASTRRIAQDACHPFHIRTVRRLAAFDSNKLHFAVHCPGSLSAKAVVRNWVRRRVREGVRRELRAGGWDREGRWVGKDGEMDGDRTEGKGLKGALKVFVSADKRVIVADEEEVRRECAWVVGRVVEMQGKTTGRAAG